LRGNKRLFKGLYIYDKWNWEDKYPVIKLSFSGNRNIDELKQSMGKNLDFAQKKVRNKIGQKAMIYAICFLLGF